MAKYDPQLDHLFHALSDPTRRMMLNRLARVAGAGQRTGGTRRGLKLPTILRHLSVLEEAGLVATQKDGRVRSCAFQPEALNPMRDWLEEQRAVWEARLDRLDDYVMKLMKERREMTLTQNLTPTLDLVLTREINAPREILYDVLDHARASGPLVRAEAAQGHGLRAGRPPRRQVQHDLRCRGQPDGEQGRLP